MFKHYFSMLYVDKTTGEILTFEKPDIDCTYLLFCVKNVLLSRNGLIVGTISPKWVLV